MRLEGRAIACSPTGLELGQKFEWFSRSLS